MMYNDVEVDGNGLGISDDFQLRLVPSRVSIGILLQGCFLVDKKACDALRSCCAIATLLMLRLARLFKML